MLLSGTDETFEQTVHARTSYRTREIVWNARFRSMFCARRARLAGRGWTSAACTRSSASS